jgi:hypothetical protein
LERDHVHYVVLWDFTLDIPEADHATGNHLGPLIAYLGSHYRVVKAFPDGDLVWERNESEPEKSLSITESRLP